MGNYRFPFYKADGILFLKNRHFGRISKGMDGIIRTFWRIPSVLKRFI